MPGKKILWLCSWYPNRIEPFSGDFIQRHARAVSLYDSVHVVHVAGYNHPSLVNDESNVSVTGNLSEHIILYKRGGSAISAVASYHKWLRLCKKAVKEYMSKNGKPDYVHVHVPLKAGIVALWLKQKYGLPFLLTEHWGIYNDVVDDNYKRRNSIFKKLTKQIVTGAAKLISVSKYLGDGVNAMVVQKPYTVVVNTADTSLFRYAEKKAGRFRFIHVSNMVPLKNAEGIVRAFKDFLNQAGNAELVMVGNTGNEIVSYANQLGLKDGEIQFRGEVSYAQVAAEMKMADCLVLFSNIENSPCVIGEALCCGLPVVATEVGGIPELVDNSNSILIAPRDEAGLTAAIKKMAGKASLYDRKKIAENAMGKFSYPAIGLQISNLYSDD